MSEFRGLSSYPTELTAEPDMFFPNNKLNKERQKKIEEETHTSIYVCTYSVPSIYNMLYVRTYTYVYMLTIYRHSNIKCRGGHNFGLTFFFYVWEY